MNMLCDKSEILVQCGGVSAAGVQRVQAAGAGSGWFAERFQLSKIY